LRHDETNHTFDCQQRKHGQTGKNSYLIIRYQSLSTRQQREQTTSLQPAVGSFVALTGRLESFFSPQHPTKSRSIISASTWTTSLTLFNKPHIQEDILFFLGFRRLSGYKPTIST
jgi:hypothetical protein